MNFSCRLMISLGLQRLMAIVLEEDHGQIALSIRTRQVIDFTEARNRSVL